MTVYFDDMNIPEPLPLATQAMKALDEHEWGLAIELAMRLVDLNREDPFARSILGVALCFGGNPSNRSTTACIASFWYSRLESNLNFTIYLLIPSGTLSVQLYRGLGYERRTSVQRLL